MPRQQLKTGCFLITSCGSLFLLYAPVVITNERKREFSLLLSEGKNQLSMCEGRWGVSAGGLSAGEPGYVIHSNILEFRREPFKLVEIGLQVCSRHPAYVTRVWVFVLDGAARGYFRTQQHCTP